MKTFDAQGTAALTPYPALIDALSAAALEVASGKISCPQRQVLALQGGGALLSMVAVAADLAVHKLVTFVPANPGRAMPAIQGQVSAWDAHTGEHLLTLDGATVTGRRTAALSLLGVRTLLAHQPKRFRLFGTGTQARHHLEAILEVYPEARVEISGRSPEASEKFCRRHEDPRSRLSYSRMASVDEEVDVVICCTTSQQPVYVDPARPGRLVIAVGSFTPEAAEIGAGTVRASQVFVDDLEGARHEAGDLLRAGVDWQQVQPLSGQLKSGAAPPGPLLLKTVGCAAWDLAAARVAIARASV